MMGRLFLPKGDRAARRRRWMLLGAGALLLFSSDTLLTGQAARLRWVPRLPDPLLRSWVRVNPRDPVGHYESGLRARRSGRPDQAAASFRRAAEVSPDFVRAKAYLAESLLDRGSFDEAYQLAQGCLDAHPHLSMALVVLGRLHAERGDWQKALNVAEAACRAEPRLPEAWLLAGRARGIRGDRDAARDCATRATALDPRSPDAWVLLSESRLALGDGPGSVAAARTARQLEPTDSRGRVALGEALLASQDPGAAREALDCLNPVLQDPGGRAAAGRAEALYRLGERAAARREARQAIREWPLRNELRSLLAKSFAAEGEQAAAAYWTHEHRRWDGMLREKSRLERAVFGTSYDQSVHLRLAALLAKMGQWDGALREGRRGLQLISQPGAREFWRRLQAAHAVRDDPKATLQALARLRAPLRQLGS